MTIHLHSEVNRMMLALLESGLHPVEANQLVEEWRRTTDILREHCECCGRKVMLTSEIKCVDCDRENVPWGKCPRTGLPSAWAIR